MYVTNNSTTSYCQWQLTKCRPTTRGDRRHTRAALALHRHTHACRGSSARVKITQIAPKKWSPTTGGGTATSFPHGRAQGLPSCREHPHLPGTRPSPLRKVGAIDVFIALTSRLRIPQYCELPERVNVVVIRLAHLKRLWLEEVCGPVAFAHFWRLWRQLAYGEWQNVFLEPESAKERLCISRWRESLRCCICTQIREKCRAALGECWSTGQGGS